MERWFDVVVLGGGPGGYPGAIRLGEHGFSVGLVEGDRLGGECTNYGCVPTKALLRAARLARDIARFPWASGSVERGGVMGWVGDIVSSVRGGVERLLASRGVEVVYGRARGVKDKCLVLDSGDRVCWRRALLLAVGSAPRSLPGVPFDGELVVSNRELLSAQRLPKSLLVAGAGYVGVELSWALAGLGIEVTVVEIADRPLPGMPREAGLQALRALRSAGVRVLTGSRIERVEKSGEGARAVVSGRRRVVVEAEKLLVSIGRMPRPLPEGVESLGVKVERGYVRVDCGMRAAPGVYAAGDITGPPLLAHKAIVESLVAAENIAGRSVCLEGMVYPEVVYISPEIALARAQGSHKGVLVRGRVEALARARIEGEGGLVELVYEEATGRLLQALLVFEGASEVIGAIAGSILRGATLQELAETVWPHPTLSEAIGEVAHLALGRPVHLLGGVRRRVRL